MDAQQFDAIIRSAGPGASRRSLLAGLLGGGGVASIQFPSESMVRPDAGNFSDRDRSNLG